MHKKLAQKQQKTGNILTAVWFRFRSILRGELQTGTKFE